MHRGRGRLRSVAACAVALAVTFASTSLACVAQRPLRGPVYIDLGISPGYVSNATSVAVGLGTYVGAQLVAVFAIRRFASAWSVSFALCIAAVGGLLLSFAIV